MVLVAEAVPWYDRPFGLAQCYLAKEAIMNCDICGQGVENSEELHKHMEQAHPTGPGDLETPDLLGDTPEESAASEVRQATH